MCSKCPTSTPPVATTPQEASFDAFARRYAHARREALATTSRTLRAALTFRGRSFS